MARTDAQSEVAQAVVELYRVFGPYRLGDDFTGCDHCVDPRETAHLAKTPLGELSTSDLRHYAFSALSTWGEVRHFKHFLPRLLELAADASSQFELEVLFSKLAYSNWSGWPAVERVAVEQYMRCFWAGQLVCDVESEMDDRLDIALCALGQSVDDLSPFLLSWIATDSNSACRQLAHYFLHNYDQIIGHGALWSPFWDGRAKQAAQVIAWLRSAEVYEYLFDRQEQLNDRLKIAVPLLAEWQCTPSKQ